MSERSSNAQPTGEAQGIKTRKCKPTFLLMSFLTLLKKLILNRLNSISIVLKVHLKVLY